jgi:signal transduction histidine kinase
LRADCLTLVDESIANVRELSQLLRPVILDDFGLDSGLRWLTDGFAQRTQIKVDYQSNVTGRFAEEVETHLFRIAQEALTNIARHADATEVLVSLVSDPQKVTLSLADNGRGMPQDTAIRPSLGMVGMKARARHCGGELEVLANAPRGVLLRASIPLRPETREVD